MPQAEPDSGIAGVRAGKTYSFDALVKQADVKVTGTGKVFINAILEDVTGRIEVIMWGPAEADIDAFTNHDVVRITGRCGTYKNKQQLTIEAVHAVAEGEIEWGCVLQRSKWDVEWMKTRVLQLCEPLQHGLRELVEALATTEDFCNKPAATFMHHAFVHGLMEHSLSVCENAIKYSDFEFKTDCDRSVLVASALLHDVGKVHEYAMTGKRLPAAKTLGHSLMGCEMVMQAAFTLDVEPEHLDRVRHVIASHHARPEWGAVVEPQSKEAWLIHCMDLADSRVFAAEKKA